MDKAFFEWLAKVCEAAGWPLDSGQYMLPDSDPMWFEGYKAGVSPQDAVATYTERTAEDQELADLTAG